MSSSIPSSVFQFLHDITKNNNRDWFAEHKPKYQEAHESLVKFADEVIHKMNQTDTIETVSGKKAIFRIYKDVRFSKDKQPYKTQVSAIVTPSGKKSKAINGVYFELGPEHLRVYGGAYEIEKEDILSMREGIADNIKEFQKKYTDPLFVKTFGELKGEKNKIIPKELKEAAEKESLIFNKQWYFYTQFEPETILFDNLDETIINCYKAGRPVEEFFNKLIKK